MSTQTNSSSRGTIRKNHGPKRRMFHYGESKCLRIELGRAGLFSKYSDKTAWLQACVARGAHWDVKTTNEKYADFCALKPIPKTQNDPGKNIREMQDAWFANIKAGKKKIVKDA